MSAKVLFRRMTPKKIMEGVFGKPRPYCVVFSPGGEPLLTRATAVHKPTGISSAQALRDLQRHFNPSGLFAPLLESEREVREKERHNQCKKRKDKRIQVKIGHGGTLDPLATGVLIAGIGKGTKSLQDFLLCTKVYETVVLFGTSTDTYDRVGKVLSRAPYAHITKEMVEEALEKFRGKFMQLPPLFSALKMDGKPLYEYAREGKEIPRQIERRPVEVLKLELVEWMEGGTHPHVAPTDEAGYAEINVANKLWKQENVLPGSGESNVKNEDAEGEGRKLDHPDSRMLKDVASQPRGSGGVPESSPQVDAPLEKDNIKQEKADTSIVGHHVGNEDVSEFSVGCGCIELSSETQPEKSAVDGRNKLVGGERGGEYIPEDVRENAATDTLDDKNSTDQPSTDMDTTMEAEAAALSSFERQKRKLSEDQDDLILERPPPKLRKGKAPPPSSEDTALMSGGLPSPSREPATTPVPTIETSSIPATTSTSTLEPDSKDKGPPAVRLKMTVTSGFYVRSLCHDLGAAVGSAALMAELERTRQGEFELEKNVLEWDDLAKGEKVWGPIVEEALDEWHSKHRR